MFTLTSFIKNISKPHAPFFALLLGALNVFSFAPFFIWPIQIVGLSLLFLLLVLRQDWNAKQFALVGFFYSFGEIFFGMSWLLIAMTRFGGMPMWLGLLCLVLFASYISIFTAAIFAVCHRLSQRWALSRSAVLLLLLPALWILFECARGYILTGFPISFGYAFGASPLRSYAPIVGVYGLGGLAALLAGACTLYLVDVAWRRQAILMVIVVFGGGVCLNQITWTHPIGQPITVRLTQGNVDQGVKFSGQFVNQTLAMYANMITEQPADLIAIPETAFPIPTSQLPADYLPGLSNFAQTSKSHLFLGVVSDDGNDRYANSVIVLDGKGNNQAYRYDKHHLVPFGEFVPYGFRWLINLMQIPLGELSSPGLLQPAMRVKDQLVMPNICYEDLFGNEIASQLASQAQSKEGAASVLLNVSNLAWYGDSIAIAQHLQISQMRVLETGRPMLRSTNTGATAIIDGSGHIISQLEPQTKGTLSGSVQGMTGLTPYIRFGDKLVLLLACVALLSVYGWNKRPILHPKK